MATKEKPQLHLGRPKDKSLQAFKDFIDQMTRALVGDEVANNDTSMTEEKWAERWKQFWERAQDKEAEE